MGRLWVAGGEPLHLLQLDALPGRIPDHRVEPTLRMSVLPALATPPGKRPPSAGRPRCRRRPSRRATSPRSVRWALLHRRPPVPLPTGRTSPPPPGRACPPAAPQTQHAPASSFPRSASAARTGSRAAPVGRPSPPRHWRTARPTRALPTRRRRTWPRSAPSSSLRTRPPQWPSWRRARPADSTLRRPLAPASQQASRRGAGGGRGRRAARRQ